VTTRGSAIRAARAAAVLDPRADTRSSHWLARLSEAAHRVLYKGALSPAAVTPAAAVAAEAALPRDFTPFAWTCVLPVCWVC